MCQACRRERAIRYCEQCGREFRSVRRSRASAQRCADGQERTRFCSKGCAGRFRSLSPGERKAKKQAQTRARRALVASSWDGVTDQQIFARDDWECQIAGCGLGPLRRDLLWPDALSPSIDHLVPLSLGGTDIASNKRAAHLYCNVARHNRMSPEEKKLVMPELAPLGLLSGRSGPCRWCGTVVPVGKPLRREFTICSTCRRVGCNVCGRKMAVTLGSRPPGKRLCRSCRADARDAVRAIYGRPIDREALLARVLGGLVLECSWF